MADSKTSDLARIRDNQRRSRARRKEYLQELESKYRVCERTGAEASSEIQAAAREVAAENKRLRRLLESHGIVDPQLPNAYQSSPAASLDRALNTPKQCWPGSEERGSSAPPVQGRTLLPAAPEAAYQSQSQSPLAYPTSAPAYQAEDDPQIQQYLQQSSSTSCYDLTSIIRSVRPHMGAELEAQLGCSDGRECSIPNAQAFDILDRLSESHNGG